MSQQRFAKAEFAAWIGIIGNVVLAAIKWIVGWLSGSKALIADAVNTASDVGSSFAVLIGLKAAKKPPDEDHPYGHGKAESIAAIIVSVLVLLVGAEIAIDAVKAMISGDLEAPAWYALLALVLSMAVKEGMYQYKYRLGKKISSQALVASAWDDRTDVFASLAALLGVAGALVGKMADQPALYYLDPVASLFVSLFVLRMGYKLVSESVHNTMDHVLHPEDSTELIESVQNVRGVIAIDDLRAREHGHYVIVDVKVSVDPKITVLEGHDIAKKVKSDLMKKYDHVADVFVHINPYDPGYPYGYDTQKKNSTILH